MGGRTASAAALLRLAVYNPSRQDQTLPASTLIFGRREAVLVDAQLRRSDARRLVEMIRQGRKRLTTIVVTANMPERYFGLQTLHAAFPSARIIAPEDVANGIRRDGNLALARLGPSLGADAPSSLIVPMASADPALSVEKEVLELHTPETGEFFLWIPALRAVIGGPAVSGLGRHVSTVAQPGRIARQHRIAALDAISALHPRVVVPGRFLPGTPMTTETVRFTRDYLTAFEIDCVRSTSVEALVASMRARYPNLADEDSLVASARLARWVADQGMP